MTYYPDPLGHIVTPLSLRTNQESQLATGRYSSVSEVIRESLRLMEDREAQLSALRTELDIGIDQLDRGESIEWNSLKDGEGNQEKAIRVRSCVGPFRSW